jgi:V/A-type H+-transporting ATPase subunit K
MKFLASMIRWMKTSNIALVSIAMMTVVTVGGWMLLFGGPEKADAQESSQDETVSQEDEGVGKDSSAFGLGLLAAAISTSISSIAAGVAVSIVGSAAMGAVAEKPEVMGRSIIFVGLAEGIAIYGLIISIMILGKL